MNAKEIQRRIIIERYRRNFIVPNYTPANWWECDVFELTPAGFWREYEIKISRGDFFADAKKSTETFQFQNGRMVKDENGKWGKIKRNKHELLKQRDKSGPNQFWFVVPDGLVSVEEVPEWAGLLCLEKQSWGVNLREDKTAPKLHNNKLDEKIKEHARGICYWRMHNLLLFGKVSPDAARPE